MYEQFRKSAFITNYVFKPLKKTVHVSRNKQNLKVLAQLHKLIVLCDFFFVNQIGLYNTKCIL